MKKVYDFLKEAEVYYLATVDGDQPRVRPFGTVNIFEDKLYIQTGKVKPVSRQNSEKPKVEICAFHKGTWLRVAGQLVEDDRVEAKKAMLDSYPDLRAMYDENDDLPSTISTKSVDTPNRFISASRNSPPLSFARAPIYAADAPSFDDATSPVAQGPPPHSLTWVALSFVSSIG